MSRNEFVYTTIVISIAVAMIDFAYFFKDPQNAFLLHNALALAIGIGLSLLGAKLYNENIGDKHLHTITILLGAYMIAAHVTKLVVGKIF